MRVIPLDPETGVDGSGKPRALRIEGSVEEIEKVRNIIGPLLVCKKHDAPFIWCGCPPEGP